MFPQIHMNIYIYIYIFLGWMDINKKVSIIFAEKKCVYNRNVLYIHIYFPIWPSLVCRVTLLFPYNLAAFKFQAPRLVTESFFFIPQQILIAWAFTGVGEAKCPYHLRQKTEKEKKKKVSLSLSYNFFIYFTKLSYNL